jgi:hypothetical protein
MRPTGLGQTRIHGFPDSLGLDVLTEPIPAAEAVAELDDLAEPGRVLAAASALLVNEIGQAFGVAELGQLSRDGQLRRGYWSRPQIVTWAEQHSLEVIDDKIS